MFGGVAETYVQWTALGEVFKEGANQYIMMENPKTNQVKKVRWYSDEKHHKLMHPPECPSCTSFRFKDEEDWVYCILKKDVPEEVADQLTCRTGWRGVRFYEDAWFVHRDCIGTLLITLQNKLTVITWKEFKKFCQEDAIKRGVLDSCWLADYQKTKEPQINERKTKWDGKIRILRT